jgi:hypothetical protein
MTGSRCSANDAGPGIEQVRNRIDNDRGRWSTAVGIRDRRAGSEHHDLSSGRLCDGKRRQQCNDRNQ